MRIFKKVSAIFLIILFTVGLASCSANSDTEESTITSSKLSDTEVNAINHKTVKVPFRKILSPVIYNDDLIMAVATEDRTETDCYYLILYDIETGKYETIFESEHEYANIQHIQCNDNWLVWNDVELYASSSVTYFMNLATKKITKANEFNPEAPSTTIPKLMGDYIYWIEEEGIKNEKIFGSVYSFNCKTQKRERIAKLDDVYLYNLSLDANDGKVVWNEQKDNAWAIYVYDIAAKQTAKYDTGEDCCYGVNCKNGCVLFLETKDYYRGDASKKTRLLDLSTGKITDAGLMPGQAAMFGDYAFACSATAVWFYKRSGDSFKPIDGLVDKNAVAAYYGGDNTVISVAKNAGFGSEEAVNETELHIFDFNKLNAA